MIWASHMMAGAVAGAKLHNPVAIAAAALASHFVLDAIPHKEYDIFEIKKVKFDRGFWTDFLKVLADFLSGLILGIYFGLKSSNLFNILLAMFFSLLPDFLLFISYLYNPPLMRKLTYFHEWIHWHKGKKIPYWLKIFTQAAVIILAIFILN